MLKQPSGDGVHFITEQFGAVTARVVLKSRHRAPSPGVGVLQIHRGILEVKIEVPTVKIATPKHKMQTARNSIQRNGTN
ncbi:MAG: hypothetical protein IPG61_08435 [bacterium]|nr:hypothetical protein [bacterium]